jgi:hypothetical protein
MTGGGPRRHVLIGVAVGVVAIALLVAAVILLREPSTPVAETDVVATFQSTTTAADPGLPEREAPVGVYAYATTGFEEIDALTGARHDYPAETFITVTNTACGVRLRWDVLEERHEEKDLCRTEAGWVLASGTDYHEWFSVPEVREDVCDESSLYVPLTAVTPPWTFSCASQDRGSDYRGQVVGRETLVIDGEEADAVHVRLTYEDSGAGSGTATIDQWWLDGTPLLLQEVASNSSLNSSAIGDVNYVESYEIVLRSLDPVNPPAS